MKIDNRKFFLIHGFALLNCLAAFFLTKWIRPYFDTHFFEFFQAAVVLSAWYGGLGPGVLAATVSFVAIDYFFLHPINAFVVNSTDFMRLVIFEAVAILTSSLSGKLKRAYGELERAHQDLELRIQERTRELSEANKNLVHEVAQRNEAEKAIMEISNREQRRLGQDLHDGLSQVLAGVKLMTERVKQELTDISAGESKKVAIIESRLAEALTFVDTISRGLYPVELEANGLMAALEELVQNISKVHPVRCRFICWKPVSLTDSALANNVYRIVQEAVINAVKGGKATKINVKLAQFRDQMKLTVADNGSGLGNLPMRKGMGLKLMEYRTRVINGNIRIQSRSKGGTRISCTFPSQNEIRVNDYGL